MVTYFGLGLVTAGITLAIFPPQVGYRPPLGLMLLALVAYVLLWPFLAMIGAGYLIGRICSYRRGGFSVRHPFRPEKRFMYRSLYEETSN